MPDRNTRIARLSELTDVQLDRLIFSLWDFQQALSALTFLMEDCDFEAKYSKVELRRFRCYESSAIISFARPFEPGRNQTIIGLRAIGFQFEPTELKLHGKLMQLRRSVVAHSDDGAMHYRANVHVVVDTHLNIPHFVFQESLQMPQSDHRPFEALLRRLMHTIGAALFEIAQLQPQRIQKYKVPRDSISDA